MRKKAMIWTRDYNRSNKFYITAKVHLYDIYIFIMTVYKKWMYMIQFHSLGHSLIFILCSSFSSRCVSPSVPSSVSSLSFACSPVCFSCLARTYSLHLLFCISLTCCMTLKVTYCSFTSHLFPINSLIVSTSLWTLFIFDL